MARKRNKQVDKRSTADRYTSVMFSNPTACRKAHNYIERIVVNSRSKKKRSVQALVYMNVNGKRQSFTRHVPDHIMNMLSTHSAVQIVNKVAA